MTNGSHSGSGRPPGSEANPQTRLARRLLDELHHRTDLILFSQNAAPRWTDALLAETRFHLAGTMNAMEIAIKLEATDPEVAAQLNALPEPFCSLALERQVDLLSPELIGHFRLRGALAVVLRGRSDSAVGGPAGDLLAQAGEGDFAQSLAALNLAEQRWTGPMLLDAPMRPDLPAEQFCDLAWTAAALLIRGAGEASDARDSSDRALLRGVIHAVERVIARHDEGSGPFALARRCARALTPEERLRLAPAALVECRLLLFCALVEAETGLPIDQVLGSLIDGGDEARHAILSLLRVDGTFAVHVYEMLAPLTGGAADNDAGLAEFVERYAAFDPAAAADWLAARLVPPALSAKLAIIDPDAT